MERIYSVASTGCSMIEAVFSSCFRTDVPSSQYTPTAISWGVFSLHVHSKYEVWHWWQGITEHFPHCPPSVGSPRCYRLQSAAGSVVLPACHRVLVAARGLPAACIGTHTMRVGSPPFQLGQQLWSGPRRGPCSACQRCHPMTDSQIHSFNTSGV